MNADQNRAKSIFLNAAEITARADQEAYLTAQCGDDEALRHEVAELLAHHAQARAFLESPASNFPATMEERASERPGTVIGPYKLLQQIGEGGMGTVWMAQQTEPVKRLVAVKLIKAGMDSRQVIARFEAERQALALMDHPNIARVLEAGTTKGEPGGISPGKPYFVMDLVKGLPITKYCDEHHLTPWQRLELFLPVCQAIQHAHQKGVIHRDLKPSNLLVALYDGKPVPKVIDFGVAKAVGQPLTEKTLVTGFGNIIGTLEYMSPEQAEINQLDIDTRSDIYSLGVLLYELLTGSTPFSKKDLKKAGMLEMLRVIREEEPSKPSTKLSTAEGLPTLAANRGTEPAKLTKLVRGELDWIVMKALEKDRSRRYETANGFAMDVQRYLADEAVLACPPAAVYRLKKFVRRNKGAVLAAVVVLLTLVGGIVGTTFGLVRAEQRAEGERLARKEAQEREAETKAALDFVEQKVFAAARPWGQDGGLGHDVTLRQAMKAALPFVDQSFTDQPLIEARLRMTLGWSFWCVGDPKIAAEQFETARTVYIRLRGADHPDTLLGMNNLANCYFDLGRFAEALQLHEETLGLRKVKLGADHPDTLMSMTNVGFLYDVFDRSEDALKLGQEALALRRAKLGPDHPHTLLSMLGVARSLTLLNRNVEALNLWQETLALQKATLGPRHLLVFHSMRMMAMVYTKLGRHENALKLCEELLPLVQAHVGSDNPITLLYMAALAGSYARAGRQAEALALREKMLAIAKAKLDPDHPDRLMSMADLAVSLMGFNRVAEATPLIDEYVRRAQGKRLRPGGPPRLPQLIELRLRHFEKNKDASGCRATAEVWERLNRADAGSLYDAACWRAVTAAVVKVDPKTPGADATMLATEEADQAMAWLHKAVAAGFMNAEHMKQDKDLDALREREDFKKLLAELQAKKK